MGNDIVGHVTRFGNIFNCKSFWQTRQEVSSRYLPLKSFLIVGIVLDPNLIRVDSSLLLLLLLSQLSLRSLLSLLSLLLQMSLLSLFSLV